MQPGESREELIVLNPTEESRKDITELAPRLGTFDGKVLGFLWNSKRHGDRLLKCLADKLSERYALRRVMHMQKTVVGLMAPDEMLKELVSTCDAVIGALAD